MSFGQLLGYAGAIVAILGVVWVGVAWGRGSTLKATNDMLETALTQERDERLEVERRCAVQIAELRAQLDELRRHE